MNVVVCTRYQGKMHSKIVTLRFVCVGGICRYCNQCRVICTAAVPVDELFSGKEKGQDAALTLEFTTFETEVEGATSRRDVSGM